MNKKTQMAMVEVETELSQEQVKQAIELGLKAQLGILTTTEDDNRLRPLGECVQVVTATVDQTKRGEVAELISAVDHLLGAADTCRTIDGICPLCAHNAKEDHGPACPVKKLELAREALRQS